VAYDDKEASRDAETNHNHNSNTIASSTEDSDTDGQSPSTSIHNCLIPGAKSRVKDGCYGLNSDTHPKVGNSDNSGYIDTKGLAVDVQPQLNDGRNGLSIDSHPQHKDYKIDSSIASHPQLNDGRNGLSIDSQPKIGNSSTTFFDSDDEEVPASFSENRGIYWCHCGKYYTNSSAFNKHKSECAYDERVSAYKCGCGGSFRYLSDYKSHTCASSTNAITTVKANSTNCDVMTPFQIVKDGNESSASSDDNSNVGSKRKRCNKKKKFPYKCNVVGCLRKYKTERFYNMHMLQKHSECERQLGAIRLSDRDDEEENDGSSVEYYHADYSCESNGVIPQYLTHEGINLKDRVEYAMKLLELTVKICDGEERTRLAIKLASICDNFF